MFVALIVDDNARNRKLACDVLDAGGFETLEASSGTDAIVLASEHVPDVILLDLRLPDMHGADAAHVLRNAVATSRIPIVAMSAVSLDEAAEWVRAAGFAGWIDKPISVTAFADQVRGFCGRG